MGEKNFIKCSQKVSSFVKYILKNGLYIASAPPANWFADMQIFENITFLTFIHAKKAKKCISSREECINI